MRRLLATVVVGVYCAFAAAVAAAAGFAAVGTATPLADGTVLIAGGFDSFPFTLPTLATTESYRPASRTFSAAATMITARGRHAAALSSSAVLVAGGINACCDSLTAAELLPVAAPSPTPTATPTPRPTRTPRPSATPTAKRPPTPTASPEPLILTKTQPNGGGGTVWWVFFTLALAWSVFQLLRNRWLAHDE